jgi:hypothetical protein
VGGDVPVDSDALLVIDFVNLKIKPAQYFGGAHRDRVCVRVHRGECSYVYEYLHLYCVSKKRYISILQSPKANLTSEVTFFPFLVIKIESRTNNQLNICHDIKRTPATNKKPFFPPY